MNSKILLLLPILFFTHLFAKENKIWDFEYIYQLKKDQVANIYINKKGSGDKNNLYLLSFRWTLYDGSGNLIVLLKYLGYPYQYALRKERLRDRIKIPLLSRSKNHIQDTYALIVFSAFNKKKMLADFDVYIKDSDKQLLIDFKKGK